jgi:hypothetical protein
LFTLRGIEVPLGGDTTFPKTVPPFKFLGRKFASAESLDRHAAFGKSSRERMATKLV